MDPPTLPSTQSSTVTSEVIVNIVFGIFATLISAVTIYQGHRLWKLWKRHHASPVGMLLALCLSELSTLLFVVPFTNASIS